jgi:diguanylate cyclase
MVDAAFGSARSARPNAVLQQLARKSATIATKGLMGTCRSADLFFASHGLSLRCEVRAPPSIEALFARMTKARPEVFKVKQYKCSLLVVDDEPYILATLAALLNTEFEVLTANSVESAKQILNDRGVDIILSDQRMPRTSGVQLLEWVRQHQPKTVRLLMTGFAELEEAVDAINKSQVFRYIFKPWRAEELLETLRSAAHTFELERSHERLLEELRQLNLALDKKVQERTHQLEDANYELEQKNKMLEKLALTDPLTQLPNRRAMDRLTERELRRRDRYPSPMALGLVDVDHFKQINSRFLLPGGDKVLVDLARVLASSLRHVDLIGRIGGEEFLVIAPETNVDGANVLAERIRSNVENYTFLYKDDKIPVTVSVAFAVLLADGQADFEQIKHVAAAALAEAKMTGRNRCVIQTVAPRPFEQAG